MTLDMTDLRVKKSVKGCVIFFFVVTLNILLGFLQNLKCENMTLQIEN